MTRERQKVVRCREEFEGQGSPSLCLMHLMDTGDIPMTRDEWLATNRGWGDVPDPVDESLMPEQFQRKTLVETPPASDEIQ